MAGAPGLVHLDQHGIAVAVERNGDHPLHMPRGLALDPVLTAAARPVGTPAGGQRPVQRLIVHPGQHEHLSGVVLLGDRGDQPVRVALEPGGDRGVQRGRADGTLRHTWPPLVIPRSYESWPGGDPLEPPRAQGPGSFVTGPWAADRAAGSFAPAPPPHPRRTIAG